MDDACFVGSFSLFVSDGRKSIRIVNIVICSDVTFDCLLRWIMELDGSGCGLFL